MPIDYTEADRICELTFGKFRAATLGLGFSPHGLLSQKIVDLINGKIATLPHNEAHILATASVEMWHRSIHSFLWAIALTDRSPLWASITGYYASHFVMRAFAYSMGIFKSFCLHKAIQITLQSGHCVATVLEGKKYQKGEHSFYWMAVKDHPNLNSNPLFRDNYERDPKSDSAHRTYANYMDHINSFVPLDLLERDHIKETVERISRIRVNSITNTAIELGVYPDVKTVQILAYQRIIAYRDFFDQKLSDNRFWQAHRTPNWCRDTMLYQVETQSLEVPT